MANESMDTTPAVWKTKQVYAMAAACLFVGLVVGYLFRGSASTPRTAQPVQAAQPAAGMNGEATPHPMPTLEQMKTMADKKAEPLIARIQTEPKNADLLTEIGNIYQATHQFKQAAEFYDKSLKIAPKNVAVRTQLSSCLFYDGDVDGALNVLQQSLKYDPKDANSLFNLGMIRLKGKNDKTGAIAAWQELLKTNPKLEKRPVVEKMIAEAKQ